MGSSVGKLLGVVWWTSEVVRSPLKNMWVCVLISVLPAMFLRAEHILHLLPVHFYSKRHSFLGLQNWWFLKEIFWPLWKFIFGALESSGISLWTSNKVFPPAKKSTLLAFGFLEIWLINTYTHNLLSTNQSSENSRVPLGSDRFEF